MSAVYQQSPQVESSSRRVPRGYFGRVDGAILPIGILLLCLAGSFFYAFPVLAVSFLAIGVIGAYSQDAKLVGSSIVVITCSLLAWVNSGKSISGDWTWYTTHFGYLEYTNLSDYLGQKVGLVRPQRSEPVYYLISLIVSRASDASVATLAVVVTVLVYGCVGLAIVYFASSLTNDRFIVSVATFAGLSMGVTFTLSTQLVRQEIAAGLFALSLLLIGKSKYWAGAGLMIVGCLTHNSLLIPVASVVVALAIRRWSAHAFVGLVLGSVAFYAFGALYLRRIGSEAYLGGDDGSISAWVFVLDLFLVSAFYYTAYRSGDLFRAGPTSLIAFTIPCFYGFVLALAGEPIPFLRMYFFIEVLRATVLCYLICRWLSGGYAKVLGSAIVLVGIFYIQLRIDRAPFVYYRSFVDVLLWHWSSKGS